MRYCYSLSLSVHFYLSLHFPRILSTAPASTGFGGFGLPAAAPATGFGLPAAAPATGFGLPAASAARYNVSQLISSLPSSDCLFSLTENKNKLSCSALILS